jgi:hypothetical protein
LCCHAHRSLFLDSKQAGSQREPALGPKLLYFA